MRIISKKTDYYDCIQAYGQDRTCTWVRDFETIRIPKTKLFSNSIYVKPVVIGFCGQLYPGLGIDGIYYYSFADFESALQGKYQGSKALEKYENPKKFRPREMWYNSPDYFGFDKRSVKSFFTEPFSFPNFFIKYKCPVFVIQNLYSRDTTFVTLHGPKEEVSRVKGPDKFLLSDFSFYRVVYTFEAFQKIHQYLMSGEIGFTEPVIPVPDDKTMAQIKGFDKYSFRKDKKNL